jgi:hypothetical protein
MNPSAYGRSIIRTVVPIIVGSVIAWLAARGVKVDEATILPAVDAVVAAAYYALIRLVEDKWPKAGWLLGSPGAPTYASATPSPSTLTIPTTSGSSDGPSSLLFSTVEEDG